MSDIGNPRETTTFTQSHNQETAPGHSGASESSNSRGPRAFPLDNLRGVLILLVVAHHALLAYVSYAPAAGTFPWATGPMLWRAFPIVDAARSASLDLVVAFNDAFFMSLFFLLSGLFTWQGLARKGERGFLQSRGRRLGIPFIASAIFLAPLAYYPSYLQHGGESGLFSFASVWNSLRVWPAGPAWFLWVLLAFSVLATLIYRSKSNFGETLGARLGPLGERPAIFFLALVAGSATLYLGTTYFVDPLHWFEWGPFSVQTSRILHYLLYFLVGVGLGEYGVNKGLFSPQGRLARRWPLWLALCGVVFIALMATVIALFTQLEAGTINTTLQRAANFGFVLSCAASSLFFISFFVRFGGWQSGLWKSLGRNAFGIFLLHYVFCSWLQFAFLGSTFSAPLKAALVFVGATILSWATSILLRRIPVVDRTI